MARVATLSKPTRSGLSECVQKYKTAISDPWNPFAAGACIPRHNSRPSHKLTLYARAPLASSGAGTWYIALTPCLANDLPTMWSVFLPSGTTYKYPPFSYYNTGGATSWGGTATGVKGYVVPSSTNSTPSQGIFNVTVTDGYIAPGVIISFTSPSALTLNILAQLTGTPGGVGQYLVNPSVTFGTSGTVATSSAAAVDSSLVQATSVKFNSPYPSGVFSANYNSAGTTGTCTGRMISFGASIEYTGTTLNQGGTYYSYIAPDHGNINSPVYFPGSGTVGGTLGNMLETSIKAVSRRKEWLVMSSSTDREYSYPDANDQQASWGLADNPYALLYPYSSGLALYPGSLLGATPAMIVATSSAASAFQVEVIAHAEYMGASATASLTPSHADSVGLEIVSQASTMLPQLRVAQPNTPMPTLMDKAISMVIEELRPTVSAAGKTAAYMGLRGLATRMGSMSVSNAILM